MTPVRIFNLLFGIAVAALGWKLDAILATPGVPFLDRLLLFGGLALAAATALPPRVLARFHLVAFSCGLPIVLFDLAAQALTPKWEPVLVDSRSLSRLNPGAVTHYAVRDGDRIGSVEVRINSDGYRGPELEAAPERRIAVYGDSFIYAASSAEEHTFPMRLRLELEAKSGAKAEVINAGVPGQGPDQLLLRMQDELPKLKPDLVVVSIFCGNDYGDLLRNRLFELDEQGRLVRAPTQLDEDLSRSARLPRFRSYILSQISKLRAQSAPSGAASPMDASGHPKLDTKWLDTFLEWRRAEYEKAVVRRDYVVSRKELVDDYPDADVAFEPGSESARYKTALMEQILTAIEDAVRASDAELAVLLIPDPDHLIENYDGHVIDPKAWPDFDPTIATGQISQFLSSRGVPAVDLFPIYAERNPGELYLSLGDNHWNDAGQALAAEAFSAFLIEQGLYP